jgi:hypothetical protein
MESEAIRLSDFVLTSTLLDKTKKTAFTED